MNLADTLQDFRDCIHRCNELIVVAHGDHGLFKSAHIEQVTISAFLNLFIGWEKFLEQALVGYMLGLPTLNGKFPVKYVSPIDWTAAQNILKGVNTYFSYSNHGNVKKIVRMYFENGYPFEPCLSSINQQLEHLKTMRNSSAHIDTTTQAKLDNVHNAILGRPTTNTSLYQLLLSPIPAERGVKVYEKYRDTLEAAASDIATG